MRQRLALAQALLPRPQLLLLDEPTNGLDPDGIVEFRQRVRKLRDDFGITVLLNSHLLAEVEQLCDRVAILRNGKKVFEGACADLNSSGPVFHLDTGNWTAVEPIIQQLGGTILSPGAIRLPDGCDPADVVAALPWCTM
jgi:ABC-2 type transport system ATP-binding protein